MGNSTSKDPKAYLQVSRAYQGPVKATREDLSLKSRIKVHQFPLCLHSGLNPGWLIFRLIGIFPVEGTDDIRNQAIKLSYPAFHHYQAFTTYWLPFSGEFYLLIPILPGQSMNHGGSLTRIISRITQRYTDLRPGTRLLIDVHFYNREETDDIFNYFFYRASQGKERIGSNLVSQEEREGVITKKEEIEKFSEEHQETYYRNTFATFVIDFKNASPRRILDDYLLNPLVYDTGIPQNIIAE